MIIHLPPPKGYELVWSGEWQAGDLFWAHAAREWIPAVRRVGKSVNNYSVPPARRIVKTEPVGLMGQYDGAW